MTDLEGLLRLFAAGRDAWFTARRLWAIWGPVGEVSIWITPLVAVGSVLSLALLSGVAVAALATLLVALVLLYRLLTEFFGISVELNLPPTP